MAERLDKYYFEFLEIVENEMGRDEIHTTCVVEASYRSTEKTFLFSNSITVFISRKSVAF